MQHGFADRRRRDRGVAMILTLVVMSVLLLAGAVAAATRLSHLRGVGQGLAGARAYYCAEAGLAAARDLLRAHAADWNTYLRTPGWQVAGAAALDGHSLRYVVTISDDVDEFPPDAADALTDRNGIIRMTATCTDPDLATPTVLRQYLTLTPLELSGVPWTPGPVTYTP